MSKLKLPVHIGMTSREFKKRKRAELKEVIKAFYKYRIGCAYCPSYETIKKVESFLESMKESHSEKQWGR